jgi:hypothetical protein
LGTQLRQRLLLISGMPATGKTHYCGWLAEHHGYRHFEFNRDPEVRGHIASLITQERVGTSSDVICESIENVLIPFLSPDGAPAVLDFGFPPHCLPLVCMLKATGFSVWWFHANLDIARREYIRLEGDAAAPFFDRQADAVSHSWPQLKVTLKPNILTTLDDDGSRMPPKRIARRMAIVA